jgi:hypothetical protein
MITLTSRTAGAAYRFPEILEMPYEEIASVCICVAFALIRLRNQLDGNDHSDRNGSSLEYTNTDAPSYTVPDAFSYADCDTYTL